MTIVVELPFIKDVIIIRIGRDGMTTKVSAVQSAAGKAGQQTDHNADHGAEERDDQADRQRIMDGFDQKPYDVLPHARRAEPVLRRSPELIGVCIEGERVGMRKIIDDKADNQEESRDNQAGLQPEIGDFPKFFHLPSPFPQP